MAKSSAAAQSTPPVPPVPPVSVASPPPRPMRPLAPSKMQLSEYGTRHFTVTLEAGTPLHHLTDPLFWANVTQLLRPCVKVDVFDAGGAFYIELLCRDVAQARPTTGAKGGAMMVVLRHVELAPLTTKAMPNEHEIRHLGPSDGWCIIRLADERPIVRNLDSREVAEQHLRAMR